MELRYYPALITQDEGGSPADGYGVVFPDFPGCVSAGATILEAAASAAEALSLHVERMVADRDPIPKPSEPGHVPAWLAEVPGTIAAQITVGVGVPCKALG